MSGNRLRDDTLLLGVSGPSGSGKSTIARMIATEKGIGLVDEPLPARILLAHAANPQKHSFDLQKHIISGRIDGTSKLKDVHTLVFDRTIEEDREIFFKLHESLGFLSPIQVAELSHISREAEKLIGLPAAIIFITAREEVLGQRILLDNVHRRPDWLIRSLSLQCSLYKVWEHTVRIPCARIDTSGFGLENLCEVAKWCRETMVDAISGCYPKNKSLGIEWTLIDKSLYNC